MLPTILFDIDYTLVNSDIIKQTISRKLQKLLKISETEEIDLEREYLAGLKNSTNFDPHQLISFIEKRYPVSSQELEEIFFETNEFYQQALYPETKPVLKDLKQKKQSLGIFSQGDKQWQKIKLKKADIYSFFDPKFIFIEPSKLSRKILQQLPKQAIIVDDNPQIINILSQQPKITPIWINRENRQRHRQAITIFNLQQIKKI